MRELGGQRVAEGSGVSALRRDPGINCPRCEKHQSEMPEGLRMLAMTTARHYVALKGANEPLTLASNTLTGLLTFSDHCWQCDSCLLLLELLGKHLRAKLG